MKVCSKCKRNLPDEDFYKSNQTKQGLSCWCRDCTRQQVNSRGKEANRINSRKMRRKLHDYVETLKTPCAKCGNDHPYVLDFHHIDPSTKKFDIGHWYKTKDAINEEVKKCICLCRNCHQTFHYFYGSKPKDPSGDLNKFLDENWCPDEVVSEYMK